MRRQAENQPLRTVPWKLGLSWLAFAVPFVVLLVLVILGRIPLASEMGSTMLLAGGFTVAVLGAFPGWDRWGSQEQTLMSNPVRWFCVVVGAALWCSAPVVLLAAGFDWTDDVGGRRRSMPLWLLTVITWTPGVLMLIAPVWKFLARRHRDRTGTSQW